MVEGGLALGTGFLQALFILGSLPVKGGGKLLLLGVGAFQLLLHVADSLALLLQCCGGCRDPSPGCKRTRSRV